MDKFSWSDGIQAVLGSCLPCLKHSSNDSESNSYSETDHSASRIRRARSDELEGLLADMTDSNTEAETMSLHSNLGERRRQRKKKRSKWIQVFGWDLFGRPPIQLPDDEHDEDGLLPRRPAPKISSSTLDSDAALLDASVIDALSAAQVNVLVAEEEEEEERRQKEERRQLRRERKEFKRVARQLALENGGEEFEGFPGSGSSYPHIPSPFNGTFSSASRSPIKDDFVHIAPGEGDDADAEDADLGGELYTRRNNSGNSNGSDSRSRTSASLSQSNQEQSVQFNHHYISQRPPHMVALPARSDSNSSSLTPSLETPRRKKRSKSSKVSSSSASQSPSLPSPVNTSFQNAILPIVATNPAPDRIQEGTLEGFPNAFERHLNENSVLPSSGLTRAFPSPGLGGIRGKGRDMGAFLATRGDS